MENQMITKLDLYLSYQKESGDGLSTIVNERVPSYASDEQPYVEWLENVILAAVNAGKIKL